MFSAKDGKILQNNDKSDRGFFLDQTTPNSRYCKREPLDSFSLGSKLFLLEHASFPMVGVSSSWIPTPWLDKKRDILHVLYAYITCRSCRASFFLELHVRLAQHCIV